MGLVFEGKQKTVTYKKLLITIAISTQLTMPSASGDDRPPHCQADERAFKELEYVFTVFGVERTKTECERQRELTIQARTLDESYENEQLNDFIFRQKHIPQPKNMSVNGEQSMPVNELRGIPTEREASSRTIDTVSGYTTSQQ